MDRLSHETSVALDVALVMNTQMDRYYNELQEAMKTGQVETVQNCLQTCQSLGLGKFASIVSNSIDLAVEGGHTGIVKALLLRLEELEPRWLPSTLATIVSNSVNLAAEGGHVEIVKVLLSTLEELEPRWLLSTHRNALSTAIVASKFEIVKFLVLERPEQTQSTLSSMLSLSAAEGSLEMAKLKFLQSSLNRVRLALGRH